MRMIRDQYAGGIVRQYGKRNVLVTEADIESEFLIGCWTAVPKAKMTIGNPMNFIVWKGRMQVLSLFRTRIQSGVKFTCLECGTQGRLKNLRGAPACTSCHSRDLWTTMVEVANETTDGSGNDRWEQVPTGRNSTTEHAWQLATFGIQVEELRARLTGRVRDLFDILIIEGVNRESSGNYLREIADRWGCSTTAVAAHLRKLRVAVLDYVQD